MKRLLIAALAAFICLPAGATDFRAPLTDLSGTPIPDCPRDKPNCGKVMTVESAAVTALIASYEDDHRVGAQEKAARFMLAMKINGAKDVVLDASEKQLAKTMIAKLWGPLVYGRAAQIIDPDDKSVQVPKTSP